ncbi:MAG: hypothetical protein N2559_13285 [Anaerolineae bacterium]|nr:hypothetical protein [Anaerolineae bacterium]
MADIANPGSALGEAIGALLEEEIHRILKPLAEASNCVYVSTGTSHTGKSTKLILEDSDGNGYNVDSVIINHRFQPLVLIESKYIRYKKHNRDKASWVCTAHTKLRERYGTVRKSIAILMGSWSRPSKRLLHSFEVELFEITFDDICNVLAEFGINYRWAEKDRAQAEASWQKFNALSAAQRQQIGRKLIAGIRDALRASLQSALDESVPRKIKLVKAIIRSNRGETKSFVFDDVQSAVTFLQSASEERLLDMTDSPTVLKASR